jgi:hypothetical protein
MFLDEYGWTGTRPAFFDAVRGCIQAHAAGLRRLAGTGDPLFTRIVAQGAVDDLNVALAALQEIR